MAYTVSVHVLQFCEAKGSIKDEHPGLLPFCRTLEDILLDGLRGSLLGSGEGSGGDGEGGMAGSGARLSGAVRKSYWEWLCVLPRAFTIATLGSPLVMAIEMAAAERKTLFARGKGRLLLRALLCRGLLTKALAALRLRKDVLADYYEEGSIVGDEVLGEILLSLLLPLEGSLVKFTLNLR